MLAAVPHSLLAQTPPAEPPASPSPGPPQPPVPPATPQPQEPPLPGLDHPPPEPINPQAATKHDLRKQPAPGYPREQPEPSARPPKAPGEGRPDEYQNVPKRKPGRGNGLALARAHELARTRRAANSSLGRPQSFTLGLG